MFVRTGLQGCKTFDYLAVLTYIEHEFGQKDGRIHRRPLYSVYTIAYTGPGHFSSKTGDLFLLITLLFTRGRPFFRHAKNCRSFCGAPFCGAPVRPNMLNMPKSAAEHIGYHAASRAKNRYPVG